VSQNCGNTGGILAPRIVVSGGQLGQPSNGQIVQGQLRPVLPQASQQSSANQILVTSGNQLITSSAGSQLITQGNHIVGQINQAGQIVAPNNGNTVLVQQNAASGGKQTLYILPAGQKMVPQQQMLVATTHQQQQAANISSPSLSGMPANNANKILQPAPTTPHVPAPQILSSGIVRRQPSGPPTGPPTGHPPTGHPPKPGGLQFLCEWRGCKIAFATAQQVYFHACTAHCPHSAPEVACQWAGCDGMTRRRFSAMTHLHDRHCNEQLLTHAARRRAAAVAAGVAPPSPPQLPPSHPGYAANAAFHAIKRHAQDVLAYRDSVEKEGPVTKSIRLTAALILRNLTIYCNHGRKLVRAHENQLSTVAISALESSRTIAQVLADLSAQ